jgi:NAD(P)-dependent dehydrogenase (short-subunit alcohol dehydrogenase family)
MDLQDKVALITGGARIGAEVARALASRGARIALAYRRSRPSAEAAAKAIAEAGGEAVVAQADVTRPEEIDPLVAQVAEWFGRLDIALHMASAYEKRDWDAIDAEDWDRCMNAEARGAFLLARAAAPWMRRAGAGRIILFSDWVAASGRPRYLGFAPYYAAKSATIGVAEALALELAPQILVNAIAPGPILAPPGLSESEDAEVRRATPLGRWGGPDEIAKAVLFLIDSDFVTGETIRVDGGRHLK